MYQWKTNFWKCLFGEEEQKTTLAIVGLKNSKKTGRLKRINVWLHALEIKIRSE